MRQILTLSATVLLTSSLSLPAFSQDLRSSEGPAEFPPASFTGKQYVDSAGCVYIRAGVDGAVTWVPRVNRNRSLLCGFKPTLAAADPLPVIPDPEPEVAQTQVAATQPVETAPVVKPVTPKPEPVVAETPVLRPVTKPSIFRKPVGDPITTVASNPVSVAPKVVAPAPAPVQETVAAPKPVTTAPRTVKLTATQACLQALATGKTYINKATGLPVRCTPQETDPVPRIAKTAPQAVVKTAPKPIAQAPVVARAPVAAKPATRKLTLAQACAQAQASGKRFINKATGQPINCPSDSVTLPKGYETVWTDGRLNPNRGLPKTTGVVSTKSVAPVKTVTGSGHQYVQVGTFGVASNAQATAAKLKALGLPVRIAKYSKSGKTYRIVMAGPFASASTLQNGLRTSRNAGFSDAFTRK